MEHLKNRTGAKVVAIVNLVLCCITLTLLALLSIYLLYLLGSVSSSSEDPAVDENVKFIAVVAGVALTIGIALEILELVSAQKLLKSTQPGTNYAEAAKLARFWRNVALGLVVISLLGALTGGRRSGGNSVPGLLALILRILGLFVVHNYIKELETASLRMTHVVYAAPGGGDGHGFNAPPGSVMVVMNPQSQPPQAGFVYPNLSQVEGGYPYSDPCPKYADVVVEKR